MADAQNDTLLNMFLSPVGVAIGIGWCVCFVALCACTCIDKCEEANLKTAVPSGLPRTYQVPSTELDIVELDDGYATMDEYLQSRHGSITSD